MRGEDDRRFSIVQMIIASYHIEIIFHIGVISMINETQKNKNIAIIAVAAFFIILIAWTGARLLWLSLESHFEFTKIEWVEFTYWLIAKTILWIMPAIWMLKRCGKASEIFRIRSWIKTLAFGFGIGGALLY